MESYVHRHIHEHLPQLRRFMQSLTHKRDVTDDLVQITCLRALKSAAQFKEGNLRAWLFTIAHNAYVTHVRNAARQPYLVGLALCNHTIEGNHDINLWVQDVEKMLASLPEEMREIIKLCAVEGLTYEQASERSGALVGTVRSRYSRGRVEMRRLREERV